MIVEKEGELYYKGIADSNSFAAMGANVKPEFKAWLHDHSEILTYHDIFKMVMRPKLFDQDITDLFLDAFMDLRSPKQTIRYNDGRALGYPTGKVFIAYFQVLHPDSFNGLLSKENKAFLDFSMSELVKVPADSIVNKMPRYSRSSIALYSEVAKAQRLSAILKELYSK